MNKAARLDKALAALRARRVCDLSPSDVIALQGALVRQGLGNTSVNMRIGALSSMLGWAARMHLIEENPIRHVKPLPINEKTLRRRTRALNENEMVRLLEAAVAEDKTCCFGGPRQIPQAPFFLAALKTGCRYGELRQLTWGAVDLERGMILVRGETAKSARSREIPIHDELARTLQRLREVHGRFLGRDVEPGDRVFLAPRGEPWLACSNNANRVLYRLLDQAGIARKDDAGRQFSVHGLRHSFCTALATHGATLEHARVLMGHADVRLTSRVYSHLEAEATRVAIDALPALGKAEPVPSSKLRLA
jgi:integrase